jgi:hypothetical protein
MTVFARALYLAAVYSNISTYIPVKPRKTPNPVGNRLTSATVYKRCTINLKIFEKSKLGLLGTASIIVLYINFLSIMK